MKRAKALDAPNAQQLEAELKREKYKHQYNRALRSTVYVLIVVAAVAVLVATLWMPVFQLYGNSMSPYLQEGDIVVAVKGMEFKPGDIIGFYYGNKLLVKRYIAGPSDWVYIGEDGTVYVNEVALDEPYLTEKALGDCDIDMPYQVPEDRYFVLGDHRATSVDSRNTMVGCIAKEQIVGKIVFRIWPVNAIEKLK